MSFSTLDPNVRTFIQVLRHNLVLLPSAFPILFSLASRVEFPVFVLSFVVMA